MSEISWDNLDWSRLERLRGLFLDPSSIDGPYWRDEEDLQAYDLTFGARIGWKWDHVIRELVQRGWQPGATRIYDWGCGTAIATRRLLAAFPDHPWESVSLWDHSPKATDFAGRLIRAAHPGLECSITSPDQLASGALVLVSHALGEAGEEDLRLLWERVRQARALIVVEPGTYENSRAVIAVREALKDSFAVRAPCTHAERCGLLTEANQRHWCHHFGRVPTEVFMDADWARFSRTLGIDLRSLPISFLMLEKAGLPPAADNLSRILGHPRFYKGFARILSCQASGVTEFELPKRADKELWKTLKKDRHSGIFRWETESTRITGGEEMAFPTPPRGPGQDGL